MSHTIMVILYHRDTLVSTLKSMLVAARGVHFMHNLNNLSRGFSQRNHFIRFCRVFDSLFLFSRFRADEKLASIFFFGDDTWAICEMKNGRWWKKIRWEKTKYKRFKWEKRKCRDNAAEKKVDEIWRCVLRCLNKVSFVISLVILQRKENVLAEFCFTASSANTSGTLREHGELSTALTIPIHQTS